MSRREATYQEALAKKQYREDIAAGKIPPATNTRKQLIEQSPRKARMPRPPGLTKEQRRRLNQEENAKDRAERMARRELEKTRKAAIANGEVPAPVRTKEEIQAFNDRHAQSDMADDARRIARMINGYLILLDRRLTDMHAVQKVIKAGDLTDADAIRGAALAIKLDIELVGPAAKALKDLTATLKECREIHARGKGLEKAGAAGPGVVLNFGMQPGGARGGSEADERETRERLEFYAGAAERAVKSLTAPKPPAKVVIEALAQEVSK